MATLTAGMLICNVASLFSGVWGAVSKRAREANCSRQAIYQQKDRVVQAVAEAQQGGPSRTELQAENERLREENRQLWEELAVTAEFPSSQQQRFSTQSSNDGRRGLRSRWIAEKDPLKTCETLAHPALPFDPCVPSGRPSCC